MSVLRSRRVRWLSAIVLVTALVFLAVVVTLGRAQQQGADDPRSTTRTGAGALGQLLLDQGAQVHTTDQVAEALAGARPSATVVVASADLLGAEDAERLARAPSGRLVLLRPNSPALDRFGVAADALAAGDGTFEPGCPAAEVQLAGSVTFDDMRASYSPRGPSDVSCYRTGSGGYGYVRATTLTGGRVDLVAGGISNAQLGNAGNAAWALDVFGSQPDVVWLMAKSVPQAGAADAEPTLLPTWWEMGVVQAALALVVVGIWRGRRLGPILSEPLPVTVRASETVEGHGRLYYRLNARDRAAEALRVGARARLGRAFGHTTDPHALTEAVSARTGRPTQQVGQILFGRPPKTDDQLVTLIAELDQLEQEARQP